MQNPPQLETLTPDQLSFWMTSMMSEATQMQQQILESLSCRARLERIRMVLTDTTKYLSAAVALEAVVSPTIETTTEKKPDAGQSGEQGKPGPE